MPAKLQILFAKTLHSLEEFTIFAPKKLKTMAKYLLARYIWEVSTIYRACRITLKELNEKWRDAPYYDGKDITIKKNHLSFIRRYGRTRKYNYLSDRGRSRPA